MEVRRAKRKNITPGLLNQQATVFERKKGRKKRKHSIHEYN